MDAIMAHAGKRCLVFMSDDAKENASFYRMIRDKGFDKCVHILCGAHALHNVAKLLPNHYSSTDSLIVKLSSIFVRAPKRRTLWREDINPGVKLPPRPCATRWMTWLEVVIYLSDKKNQIAVYKAMRAFLKDQNAKEAAAEVQNLLLDRRVRKEIKYITETYSYTFIDAKNFLERRSTTIKDLVNVATVLQTEFQNNDHIPAEINAKLRDVFNKDGFNTVKHFVTNGEHTNAMLNMDDGEDNLMLNAPGSNSEAERGFSIQKLMQRPNRNRFKSDTFRQHAVSYICLNYMAKYEARETTGLPKVLKHYSTLFTSFVFEKVMN